MRFAPSCSIIVEREIALGFLVVHWVLKFDFRVVHWVVKFDFQESIESSSLTFEVVEWVIWVQWVLKFDFQLSNRSTKSSELSHFWLWIVAGPTMDLGRPCNWCCAAFWFVGLFDRFDLFPILKRHHISNYCRGQSVRAVFEASPPSKNRKMHADFQLYSFVMASLDCEW